MKITKSNLKQIIKEELNEAETLDDFWMNELNSALLASMDSAGVGNSMMPSKFLEALLPVLQAYGVADEAEEMVNHVRSNQDIYSPGLPALQELKQIIKEELSCVLLERDAAQPRRPEVIMREEVQDLARRQEMNEGMDDFEQDLYPGADERGDPDNWEHSYDDDELSFDDTNKFVKAYNMISDAVESETLPESVEDAVFDMLGKLGINL